MTEPKRGRGRPRNPYAQVAQTVKFDPDVLAACKALGPGWMPKVNEILRKALIGEKS